MKVASKSSCKFLLEQYSKRRIRLTIPHFHSILGVLERKKDGSVSEYTQKKLSVLRDCLNRNELPPPIIVGLVVEALGKGGFRRKAGEKKEELKPFVFWKE